MPVFTKMTEEDVKSLLEKKQKKEPNQREIVRQQYLDYLKQYKAGDWVSVKLDEGENRITTKNRLNKAAGELGWELQFVRSRGSLKFQIAAPLKQKKAPKPQAKKRGRPAKKVAQ